MQQEITKQREESDMLVSIIAKQHAVLQDAKGATCATKTNQKNNTYEELQTLQASTVVAEERLAKQQTDMQKIRKQAAQASNTMTQRHNSLQGEITEASTKLSNTQTDQAEQDIA